MTVQSRKIGDIEVTALNDGVLATSLDVVLGMDRAESERLAGKKAGDGVHIAVNAFLLKLASLFTPGFEVHGFFSAVIGSIVLETASEIFKNVFKKAHLLIYGVLVVLVVLFLPEGIVGTVTNKVRIFKKAPAAPFATPAPLTPEEETQRSAVRD